MPTQVMATSDKDPYKSLSMYSSGETHERVSSLKPCGDDMVPGAPMLVVLMPAVAVLLLVLVFNARAAPPTQRMAQPSDQITNGRTLHP